MDMKPLDEIFSDSSDFSNTEMDEYYRLKNFDQSVVEQFDGIRNLAERDAYNRRMEAIAAKMERQKEKKAKERSAKEALRATERRDHE